MGTSSARRGPASAAWRRAKGAATRYMAAEESPLTARELVSRYLAALEETGRASGQDLLGTFRLTRKVAQNLGALAEKAGALGLPAALVELGFPFLATMPPEVAAPCLVSLWLPGEPGLEATVLPTAVASCLKRLLPGTVPSSGSEGSAALVKSFLALVIFCRLTFDLGEPLEGAARGWQDYQQKLSRIQEELRAAAETLPLPSPGEGDWQGLSGWLWVTLVLQALLGLYHTPD